MTEIVGVAAMFCCVASLVCLRLHEVTVRRLESPEGIDESWSLWTGSNEAQMRESAVLWMRASVGALSFGVFLVLLLYLG